MNGPDPTPKPASGCGLPAWHAEHARGARWAGRTALACLLCAGALAGSAAHAAKPRGQSDDFMVIVNAGNPVEELPAAEVSKLFLKHVVRWPSGKRVVPIEPPPSSPLRESFSRAIHNRSAYTVAAYWQTMIFSGRDVPPPEEPSPAAIVAFVGAEAGAVAYVPAGTALPPSVKALKVLP